MSDTVRGLTVDVYRNSAYGGSDFSMNGVSARFDNLTITGVVGRNRRWLPLASDSQLVEPIDDKRPEAWLYRRDGIRADGQTVWAIVPACPAREGGALNAWLTRLMFGGNFAHLGDSRLARLITFYGAVAIHDRREDTR